MRFALISDIHANLQALQAVLGEINKQSVEKIHCLGDVVGYGCDPVACLDLVESHCDIKLLGNHEYSLLGLLSDKHLNSVARKSMAWTTTQVSDREFSIIADFEMDAVVENCYLVHASPFEPDQWHYILSDNDANPGFEHFKQQLCFVGHTHLPMIFSKSQDGNLRCKAGHDFDPDEETRYILNIGSVGQPRDKDPRASFVVVDTENMEINFHRVEYDVKATQAKMAAANMPKMLIERLEVGR